MEIKPLLLVYLVLCVVVFFDVLFRVKKNPLFKVCLILIVASLFVMNYFSYVNVDNRIQFILVKAARLIYACCTMLAIVYLVTPRIPWWIISITAFAIFVTTGLRIFYYDEIAIERQAEMPNQVFSVGAELYHPIPVIRYLIFLTAAVSVGFTFFSYRRFFLQLGKEKIHRKHISGWIISLAVPLFLLLIFGVLGALGFYDEVLSPYLFSFFSCVAILSILFRPSFLNARSYHDDTN